MKTWIIILQIVSIACSVSGIFLLIRYQTDYPVVMITVGAIFFGASEKAHKYYIMKKKGGG